MSKGRESTLRDRRLRSPGHFLKMKMMINIRTAVVWNTDPVHVKEKRRKTGDPIPELCRRHEIDFGFQFDYRGFSRS
ncbi:hypothetical protein [Sorangium sp. So ce1389]|uniref:hypothetical protein n=1 Tax=Sorangium sp. So ce1389 TaxID=3133336 RepID=UPI003F5EF46F